MIVIFVHGWSVRNTDTYGGLPRYLASQEGPDGRPLDVANIFLGRYVSFDDRVTLDDISRALDQALKDAVGDRIARGERLACVTHSTGGPVVRNWIQLYHGKDLARCPLSHLVMLAPANHGSALAQLGKGRLSRMKFFAQGAEPGQRVLDWLELGSDEAWSLNEAWLDHDCVPNGLFPFVLTGQTIDRSFYDALNSYTDEIGGDGVVRVAAANLNFACLELIQDAGGELVLRKSWRSKPTAMGVLPKVSHSGEDLGILRSVSAQGRRAPAVVRRLGLDSPAHPAAEWVLRCLRVVDAEGYESVRADLSSLTERVQVEEREEVQPTLLGNRTHVNARCTQVVVRLRDDRGDILTDYDLLLTAGPDYSPDALPAGFFVDRQRNSRNRGKLTYLLNWDVLGHAESGLRHPALQGRMGFRIVARPEMPGPGGAGSKARPGLAGYRALDFRSDLDGLSRVLRPNETLMLDIQLRRWVDVAVFRASNDLAPRRFDATPEGRMAT